MASRSLNQHIFRLSSGLVLLCACAILINVWFSTIDKAKKQLSSNLTVAESVLQEVLASREAQLITQAEILIYDYGFRSAVGSKDDITISDMLDNHRARIEADIMALVSLEGHVSHSTSLTLPVETAFPFPALLEQAMLEGGASEILVFDDKVYQILLLVVDVPGAPAISLLGFELNTALMERLKNITTLDISIEIRDGNNAVFAVSSLANPTKLNRNEEGLSWFRLSFFSEQQYISRALKLTEFNHIQIWAVLSEDVERLFGEFNALQIKLTAIALFSVILAMFLGAMVAKKLAKPLHNLSMLAKSISSGNYAGDIDIDGKTKEIDDLADSFKNMQLNIRERQEQISYQASHDLLTQLQNRYKIREVIEQKFDQGVSFQVVGANILGFRGINDVFGYQNGDVCLQVVSARLKSMKGEAARLNGGEFLFIPESPLSIEQLKDIQRQIQLPIIVDDVVMNVKVSMGTLTAFEDCEDTESLLRRLNICLDEARFVDGLLVEYSEDYEKRYTRRLLIISELKKALRTKNSTELSLAYQPKLHLSTGTVTHVEALIRWNSELLGFVPPDEFIGIAEQAGLIGQVTNYVIESAIIDAKTMNEAGLDICIAINLSAKDVLNPQLLKTVERYLNSYQVSSKQLSFEITESDLVSDPQRAVEELQKFRDKGFSIAIDDFGTGYSSLAYLKQFPVTELKIDKSFVLQLDQQISDQQIVQTILELAQNFGLGVIAEGAENQEALEMLKEWGCKWVQGYHVCRPIPVKEVIDWCLENQTTQWFLK